MRTETEMEKQTEGFLENQEKKLPRDCFVLLGLSLENIHHSHANSQKGRKSFFNR